MSSDTETLANLFATVSLGAPENAVGFVLWRVVHRFQREVDRALAELDLTHLQFTVLTMGAWLAKSGEPATQAELARFGDIHPMQVSHMLKALEAKGMIVRAPKPAHALAKVVAITPAGVRTLRQALPVVIDVQRRLFGDEGAPGGTFLATLLQFDRDR